ncbi:DNA primase [Candidatus Shapirobacteria bacterium CG10_big_fil_rev_8_21_14_0_10_48_15]|uniref:DNA primase n=1 Tax=Candidatus Shapirobacteria bacterium CG10_big_fil_rev_8_21_14_0_10_48_15 TaxID=1974484 RepID=A0A2M8L6G1_9BACT|nr:MAG: DNA primase [Candidatus Shapirobacteria bacterium CG10_big_fil_rev_8_21_14_0_10_48_15]
MADELEEIKRRVDIVELIGEYVSLKKTGRNFKGLCPFHSEKTPSFIVSPERQIWHCFGQCNEGGDLFGFLMKIENLEFGEALQVLAKRAGVKLTSYRPSEGERQKQLLYEANHLAAEYYHFVLTKHPAGQPARDYLAKRGISQKSVETFGLGFSPNMWDGLQRFLVAKKGYRSQDLENAGLIIRGSRGYYDRFRQRVMFPLADHRGNTRGFAGRVIDPTIKEAKYVNTPETLIYHKSDLLYGLVENKQAIKKADAAVLVEGELDMISSCQAGVNNVVAIKGSALTANQIYRLGFFTKNLVFALDADLAGNQAARRGIELADEAGMSLRAVEIEGGKDPDEVAQKSPERWRQMVAQAVAVYDFLLDLAFGRFDARTAEGKRQIGEQLVPMLAKITDEIVRSHYIQLVADRLGVAVEAVEAAVGKKVKPEGKMTVETNLAPEAQSRREILERHLLGLAFQSGQWPWLRQREVRQLIKTPRFAGIVESLGQYLPKHQTYRSESLAKVLPAELLPAFNQFYLLDLADLISEEEALKKEWGKTLVRLNQVDVREKLNQLAAEIKRLERQNQSTDKLNQEFRTLSQQLSTV